MGKGKILNWRCARSGLILLVSMCLWGGWGDIVKAAAPPEKSEQLVRVEEEWELVVATPDLDSAAPQVNCVLSPTGSLDSVHVAFELNHQSQPEFVPGGLQLQLWEGEFFLLSRKNPDDSLLNHAGEKILWKQCMELSEGVLTFEILAGSSSTWGDFGGQGYLKVLVPTTLSDLNSYDYSVSAGYSGVDYAANRVESLVLRKVRMITSSGQVIDVEPMKIVHPKK